MKAKDDALYKAVLSELLALHDCMMQSEDESVQAMGMIVLGRMRQLHRRLSPLHSCANFEIEDIVAHVEAKTAIMSDPQLNNLPSRPS